MTPSPKPRLRSEGWRAGAIDAAGLGRRLVRARARLPLVRELCRDPSVPDEEVIRRVAAIGRLREFFTALTAYAEAFEAFVSGEKPTMRRTGFARSNDPVGALWTGLRAALAVFLVSGFWILTNWPQGSTAAILGAVATARLATMAPAVPIALGGSVIFALSPSLLSSSWKYCCPSPTASRCSPSPWRRCSFCAPS